MTKNPPSRRTIYSICVVVFILVCFAVLLLEFSSKAFAQSEQFSQIQMKEVSAQTVQAVSIKIDSEVNYISALALVFATYPDLHASETLNQLFKIAEQSPFDRLRLTTPDGRSLSRPGNMIDIAERPYFRDAMAGNSGISDVMVSLYNSTPVFTVYAPILKAGKVVGIIHGARELTTLSEVLTISSENESSAFYVFKKNGDLILKSDTAQSLDPAHLNLWRFLGDTSLGKNDSLAAIQANVAQDHEGFFHYKFQGRLQLGYYTPLGINDWYLLHSTPRSSLSRLSAPFQSLAILLVLRALLILTILGIISLYFTQRARDAVIKANRELCISNERFRIAISHTPSVLFVYNLLSDCITFEGDIAPPYQLPKVIENASSYLLAQNIVEEESVEIFQKMFQDIRSGAPSVTAVLKMRTQPHPVWERVMLTTIFDDCHRPIRTIGTIENITEQVLVDLRRQQAEDRHRTLSTAALWLYDINVTQDVYYKYDPSTAPPENPIWLPYSANIIDSCRNNIFDDDRVSFMEIADRNRLMQAFEQNDTELTCEYRALKSDGSALWFQSNSHLLQDPITKDLHCYTYVKNIHASKERELALRQQAELDPLTGLYNRQAAERLISDALKDAPERSLHSFFSIDIDDFKIVNDHFGHLNGDVVLQMIADECKSLVRSKDIVARMGGDEFIIFLWGVRNLGQVETIATRLCDHIRRLVFQPEGQNVCVPISVSVGVAISPQHGISFEDLYRNSDLALYYAKQHGRNRHAVYFPGLLMEDQSQIC